MQLLNVWKLSARHPTKFQKISKKNKDVPWKDMIGMRNFLVHEYFDIDVQEVWRTVKFDLPDLKKKFKKI